MHLNSVKNELHYNAQILVIKSQTLPVLDLKVILHVSNLVIRHLFMSWGYGTNFILLL